MIELRQLRYLIAASEAGSFSRAAQRLNIKQATLSRQIAYIEKRLGLVLFERQPAGAVLTPAGQHYLSVARRVVDEFAVINDWVRGRRAGMRGRLSVGFYTSLSAGNLKSTLADFVDRYPDIEVHPVERGRSRLTDGLTNGTIDIAVMLGDATYEGVIRRALWSERLLLAFAAGHPLADCRPIRWSDVAAERFVFSISDPGPEFARIVTSKLVRADREPLIVFEDAGRETILNTVALGHHVTLVAEAAAGNRLDGIRFREIDDRDGASRVAFSGYWRDDNANPVLRSFLDLIARRYAFSA